MAVRAAAAHRARSREVAVKSLRHRHGGLRANLYFHVTSMAKK